MYFFSSACFLCYELVIRHVGNITEKIVGKILLLDSGMLTQPLDGGDLRLTASSVNRSRYCGWNLLILGYLTLDRQQDI